MTKLWIRRILAFHVAFLLVALGNCQSEDNVYDDDNLANNYDDDGEKNDGAEDDEFYVDNRIDAVPTFVSPVERFIKAIITPLGWINRNPYSQSNLSDRSVNGTQNSVGKFLEGITQPIRNIVAPAGRAISGGFGEVLNMIGDRFKAIYPGTEWCGAGDVAKNSEEVGLFKNTDSCCRAHDQCNNNIAAGGTDNGLLNNGIFTRSHCLCDARFYYCLKDAGSLVATNIGFTYFNVLRPQCFKQEYPAHCVKYGRTRLRNNKCLDYDYDYTKNKTWQWFDSPDFL